MAEWLLGLTLGQAAGLLLAASAGVTTLLGLVDVAKAVRNRAGERRSRRRERPEIAEASKQADHDKDQAERDVSDIELEDRVNRAWSDTHVASMVNDYLGMDRILNERISEGQAWVDDGLAVEKGGGYHVDTSTVPKEHQAQVEHSLTALNKGTSDLMDKMAATEDYIQQQTGIGVGTLVQVHQKGGLHLVKSPEIPDESNREELFQGLAAPDYEDANRAARGGIRARLSRVKRRPDTDAPKSIDTAVKNRTAAGAERGQPEPAGAASSRRAGSAGAPPERQPSKPRQ